MGTLIDSSVLIAAQRGQIDPARLDGEMEDEPVAMSAISASELLHGVHRVKGAVGRTRAERFVERLLAAIPVIPFDLDVARVHARLVAELSSRGKTVGDADLIIAATAVWLDYRVAARDVRSFPHIKGLVVVRW
ncbi:MAG: PIN domain-containing protein [Acidobacteria bacterium]|nr:PIN domain-containing protein [Acidobacteriota bacterium]